MMKMNYNILYWGIAMIYHDYFQNEALLEPLSQEELLSYFKAFHDGDLQARSVIIEHNLRLVCGRVYGRFSSVPCDEQEIMSYGVSGLINAVDSYDLSKGIQFSTYASTCIDNEIFVYLRKLRRVLPTDSLEREIGKENQESLRLEDTVFDPTCHFVADYVEKEMLLTIRGLVADLPLADREIIVKYFGLYGNESITQREIALSMNMSRSNVAMRLARILKTLRKRYNEEDVKVKKK